jgi:hypothetical protein
MHERVLPKLELSLLNVDRFGIRPPGKELEELVRLEYLESDENDGWNISSKGREYINLYKLKTQ